MNTHEKDVTYLKKWGMPFPLQYAHYVKKTEGCMEDMKTSQGLCLFLGKSCDSHPLCDFNTNNKESERPEGAIPLTH